MALGDAKRVLVALRGRPLPPDGFTQADWDGLMANIFKQHVFDYMSPAGSFRYDLFNNLGLVCDLLNVECDCYIVAGILDEYMECFHYVDVPPLTKQYLGKEFWSFEELFRALQDAIMRGEIV